MWRSATVKLWLCTTYIMTTKLWLSYENWHALFWWQVIEAQVDMPVVGAITLYVSLLTFTLRVHPDRLDYVDQVLVCYSSFDKIVQLEFRILVPKLLFVFRQLAAVKCSIFFCSSCFFIPFVIIPNTRVDERNRRERGYTWSKIKRIIQQNSHSFWLHWLKFLSTWPTLGHFHAHWCSFSFYRSTGSVC